MSQVLRRKTEFENNMKLRGLSANGRGGIHPKALIEELHRLSLDPFRNSSERRNARLDRCMKSDRHNPGRTICVAAENTPARRQGPLARRRCSVIQRLRPLWRLWNFLRFQKRSGKNRGNLGTPAEHTGPQLEIHAANFATKKLIESFYPCGKSLKIGGKIQCQIPS